MVPTGKPLPVHSLNHEGHLVLVQHIEHKNPYDFTKEHRHTYFEVFFFEAGGGSQLIDFNDQPIKSQSCYIVFPQQVHLMKRAASSAGKLVQFGEEVITSLHLRMLLKQHFFTETPAVIFEEDPEKFKKLGNVLNMLHDATRKESMIAREISLAYLQALLLEVMEGLEPDSGAAMSGERRLLFNFQQQLDEHFCENHQVSKYAANLNITEKKLSAITKKYLGLSPLNVIHNRLLLEAKRLFLFEEIAHKEIAFQLGFDSPASFSLFIKNKTGHNPSELNQQLVNFYK